MVGRKFRKEKNEIRYHRVDLGNEDESFLDDDESTLNRDLGPPKRHRNCGKITRGTFIVCTVLLTVAGLVSVVAYTAIVFPEGTNKQLSILYNKVFGKNGSNSTTISTNSSSTIEANVTTLPHISDDNFLANVTSTTQSLDLISRSPSTVNTTRHFENDAETKEVLENEKGEDKGTTRMKRTVSTATQQRILDMRNAEDLKHWNDVERKDLQELEKHQRKHFVSFDQATWDKRDSRDNEYKNMLDDESNQIESKYVPISMDKKEENTVNPEEYDIELNGEDQYHDLRENQQRKNDSSPLYEDGANDTNVDVDNPLEKTSVKPTTLIAQTSNPEESDQTTDYWHDMKQKLDSYNDDNELTIGFSIFLVITGTVMLLCCLYCRHKRRKAAKRRHFSRLVNDLNASEKFTLVTPSDEESD